MEGLIICAIMTVIAFAPIAWLAYSMRDEIKKLRGDVDRHESGLIHVQGMGDGLMSNDMQLQKQTDALVARIKTLESANAAPPAETGADSFTPYQRLIESIASAIEGRANLQSRPNVKKIRVGAYEMKILRESGALTHFSPSKENTLFGAKLECAAHMHGFEIL